MPAAYAHIFYGNTVFHHLPRHIQYQIRRDKDLFEVGLQGPDILFYYHPLHQNPVSLLGSQMHEESGRTWFLRALDTLEQQQETQTRETVNASRTYLYGVLCHFVLDSRCHGYINAFVNSSGITHYEVESEFDRSLMVLKQQDPLRASAIPGFHPSKHAAQAIAPFYPTLDDRTVDAALHSFVRFNELLRCPNDAKRNIIYAGLKAMGKYEELHGHIINKEPNPACVGSNEELLRRLRNAVPDGVALISSFGREEVEEDPRFDWNFEGEDHES